MAATQGGRLRDIETPTYKQITIGDFIEVLYQSSLFANCRPEMEDTKKGLTKEPAYLLAYRLGDPIIRCENKSLGQEFLLPTGEVASEKLDLMTSNPLFVIVEGYIEVHHSLSLSVHQKLEVTVPIVTLSRGSTFGEFELDIKAGTDSWKPYVAEATSGWRSAECTGKFTDRQCWKAATDVDSEPHTDMGRLLRLSFQKLSQKNPNIRYSTKIIVIPRRTVDRLLAGSPTFFRNLHQILYEHTQIHIALDVTEGRKFINLESIPEHFVEVTIPRCMSGALPVLVPCTCFPELTEWWKMFHKALHTTAQKKQLNSLNLPYMFYVPAMGEVARKVSEDAVNLMCRAPVLTRSMIRIYTNDLALGAERVLLPGKRKLCLNRGTLHKDDFLDGVRKASGVGKDAYVLEEMKTLKLSDRMKMLGFALNLDKKTLSQLQKATQNKPPKGQPYPYVEFPDGSSFSPKAAYSPKHLFYFMPRK